MQTPIRWIVFAEISNTPSLYRILKAYSRRIRAVNIRILTRVLKFSEKQIFDAR